MFGIACYLAFPETTLVLASRFDTKEGIQKWFIYLMCALTAGEFIMEQCFCLCVVFYSLLHVIRYSIRRVTILD